MHYAYRVQTTPVVRCLGAVASASPYLGEPGQDWRPITEQQFNELMDSYEPSKVVAGWLNLPYVKHLPVPQSSFNIVEVVAENEEDDEERPRFNQSCRFGCLVPHHAVYCHNSTWIDAPRKCRRTWYTGGNVKDENCPGFEPREREQ